MASKYILSFFSNCFYIFCIQHLFGIEVLHTQVNTDSYTHLQDHCSCHGYTVHFDIHPHLKDINKTNDLLNCHL